MGILSSKTAIVTGAGRGIGRATVEVFASQGASIWACARKADEAFARDMRDIADKHGVDIWPVGFEMTDESQMKQAVHQIRKQKMPVDVLVNVAGIADESTSFAMTSMEKIRHVFDVNFFSMTMFTQYISRLMARQAGGVIVNVASIAGLDGAPAQYEYAASKAAVIGGVKNLARELASSNIRVNAVAPGMVRTDMGAQIEDGLKNEMLNKVILKRIGRPEEIANVIAFLASDLSSYMTGQVIRVDGGI